MILEHLWAPFMSFLCMLFGRGRERQDSCDPKKVITALTVTYVSLEWGNEHTVMSLSKLEGTVYLFTRNTDDASQLKLLKASLQYV